MASVVDVQAGGERMRDDVFFGHPRGLAYLIAVEGFWALHAGMGVACLAFLALAGPPIAMALAAPRGDTAEVIATA